MHDLLTAWSRTAGAKFQTSHAMEFLQAGFAIMFKMTTTEAKTSTKMMIFKPGAL